MEETRGEAIARRTGECMNCTFRASLIYHGRHYLFCWYQKKLARDMDVYQHCPHRKEARETWKRSR